MPDLDTAVFNLDVYLLGMQRQRAELCWHLSELTTLQRLADLELWSTVLSMTYTDAKDLIYTWPEDRAGQLLNDWKTAA